MTLLSIPFLLSITFFIFGAVVGSFLNVCIARLPKGESMVSPPSHCPHCKTPIPFYDNIPLVDAISISYALLCTAVSRRLVEMITAVLAVALLCRLGCGILKGGNPII